MIKNLSAILFLFIVLGLTATASAQTETSDPAKTLPRTTNSVKEKATQLRTEKKEQIQELKDTIRTKREEARDAIKTKREEFRTKLQTIKDEKKKAVVERIDTKLSTINEKHTDRFAGVLEKLEMILERISVAQDQDTTDAQKVIDIAKKAVEEQAAKTYTITITDEARLRANVGAVTSQLRKDLMATHKTVVDAKQAVQALHRAENKEATGSANL